MRRFLVLSLALLAMYGCGGKPKAEEAIVNDGHNARNSLDYLGTYKGDIPFGENGANVILALKNDSAFQCTIVPKDEKNGLIAIGKYTWNKAGNSITLGGDIGSVAPNQFFVAEGKLIQLDDNGKKYEGEDADKYVLNKVEE